MKVRAPFEEKLPQMEFNGEEPTKAGVAAWISYLRFERTLSPKMYPKILFLIEKAITYCCTSPEIWREYINFLEHEMENREYLKAALFCYRKMLMNIDCNLIFLLTDLNEMES